MNEISKKIVSDFKIRKGRKKKKFRAFVMKELEAKNIPYRVQSSKRGFTNNLIVGNTDSAKVICTAHYDTPFNMLIPNVIMPTSIWRCVVSQIIMSVFLVAIMFGANYAFSLLFELIFTSIGVELGVFNNLLDSIIFILLFFAILNIPNINNLNDNTSGTITLTEAIFSGEIDFNNVAFIFFDNEEFGLLGSYMFKNAFSRNPLLVNYDCVGQGNEILVIKNKKGDFDEDMDEMIHTMFTQVEGKNLSFPTKAFYPSDQKHFNRGVGVCSCQKNKILDKYVARIHTPFDTILQEENINYTMSGILNVNAMLADSSSATNTQGAVVDEMSCSVPESEMFDTTLPTDNIDI